MHGPLRPLRQGPQYIPLPDEAAGGGGEDEVELSDEDLAFVSTHQTGLDFLARLPKKDLDRCGVCG